MASSRFQNALSLLQKKHKNTWPDPESSVGKFCGTKKGIFKCWKAQGPAQEVFQHMSIEIKDLLEKDCGPVPSSSFVHFDIFMIGETPAAAIPHIMFSCKKREPRKEALAAVRKSEILSHYTPGIELGHWDYPPYIKDLQFLGSSTESIDSDESTATPQCHLTPVYDKTQPWKVSAMQLQLSPGNDLAYLRKATVGSILEVAEKRFYLAPAHIFPGCSSTLHIISDEDTEKDDSDCEFGDFEGLGDEDEVEFMSQYSITPESSDVDSESDCDFEDYSSDGDNEDVPSIELWEEPIVDNESSIVADLSVLEVAETAREDHTVRLEIKSPSFTSVELDCALIEVGDNDYLTATLPTLSHFTVGQVEPGDVVVTTITGSGKAMTGTLSGRPLYVRLPDTRTYQKAFVVDFAEYLQPGDCGSIVRNASTGDIYGHIFAGSVESKVAYIIPAIDVLEVIEYLFDMFLTSNPYVNLLSQSSTSEVSSDANGEHVPDDALFTKEELSVPPSSEIHDFAPLLAKTGIRTHNDYNTAWICASREEFKGARMMLDEAYTPLLHLVKKSLSYALGSIGQRNIVIPNPLSEAFVWQTVSESSSRVCSTFPSIKCSRNQDNPAKRDRIAGILGKKRIPDAAKRHLCPELDRPFLSSHSRPWSPMVQAQVKHSAVNTNQPHEAGHSHECLDVNWFCSQTVHGPIQGDDEPGVHHAHFPPSNRVVKDPQTHDIVSRKSEGVLGFEAKAAGLMANFPDLILRGVCDYANTLSRQTKVDWQAYAAATAAAYARELLLSLSMEEVGSLYTNHANSYGGTSLSWDASQGQGAVVRLLLQNNPDVDWTDERERTARSMAGANVNTLTVSALLTGDADPCHRDQHGRTPSMLTAEMDHESVASLLHEEECRCHHCHRLCMKCSVDHELCIRCRH